MNTMNGYAKNILSDSYVLTSAGGHSLAGGYRNYSNISNGEEWITRSWGQYYAEIEKFDTATLLEQSHGHTLFIYRLYVDNTEGTQAVSIRYLNYLDSSNRDGGTGNSIAAGSEGWLWMPVTVDANRSIFLLLLNHSLSTTSSVKVRYVTLVKNFSDILDWTINPSLTSTEEFIVGTLTAATGSWTGVTKDANLYHGKKIIYWLPYNGSGDASLNLTLSGDTTTGAIPIYKSGTSRVTTHYSAGSAIRLIYLVNAKINGNAYTGWWADADYTDGNTYTSAYCGTSAGTAAKTATCTNYKLLTNSYLHLTVVYSNTSQTALTLNVNSLGAKPIFINGVVSSNTNYTLPAGTYLAFYDGYNYYINTDGTIPKYEKVFNKFYSLKQSVTMNTTLATWYIKIELAGYALPTLFLISGKYNNNTDRAIIETSGMSGGYIFRNVNLNSGNITGLWFKSNNDSTEKRWIFWVRLRAIQDSSTSHYSPSSSATYTVYLGDSIANFKVTATTTEPSGAVWETVGTDTTNIFIKNGTIANAVNATNATNIPVNLHTGNNTDYPLVWSNQNNTNSAHANQLFKSWQDLYYNPKNKKLTTGTYAAVTGVTTPKVESAATTLIINSGIDLYLKRANDDSKSLVLNSTSFKPFDTANAKLDLGSATARWKDVYVNKTVNITNKAGGTDTGMIVEGSSNKIGFMIGSGNVNRGIYDYTNSKWIFYKDSSTTYVNDWASIGSSTKPVYFTGGKPVACGSSLAVSITGDAHTVDGKHASDFLSITPTQFSQYKKGNWTKILTFTIPVNSITPSISFTWHPTECARYAWGDFNINIRSGAIIFKANWKGNEIRTLKCVGDGTTYDVWVYGTKEGYDPYGSIQVISTYDITSYQAGSLAYLDADPTGTYTANATKYGAVSSADKLSTVSKTAWGLTYWTNGGIPTTISGDMSNVGNVNLTGNITIDAGNTDKFINFYYSSGAKLSWRIGYLGTGSNDANYLVIQSNKSDGASWSNVLQLGCTTLNAVFGGKITSTNFIKSGSSDSYVLLGGGGHKALSEFNTSFDYLPLSGGTVGNNSSPAPLYINGNSNKAFVKFLSGTTSLGGLGFNAANKPIWVTDDSTEDVALLYAGCNASVKTLTITDTVNGYELDAACAKGVTDSSSASAISTGTNLVTERDVYYGLPTINNAHTYTSSTSIYAPTAGGTSGYYLKGNGTTAAPVWQLYSSTPTVDSTTLITSGGVYAALKGTLTPSTNATYTLGTNELRYKTGYFSNTLIVGATGMTGSTSGYAGCTFGSAGNMELVGLAGTSGPKIDFHYNKSTSDYTTLIIEQSLGNLYIKGNLYVIPTTSVSGTTTTYSTTAPFYITSSGAFWTSDRRFKTNIKSPVKSGLLEDETGFIRKFKWKETGNSSYGYIAQELLQQIPEAVDYDAELNKYSVNYDVAHSAAIAQLVIKIKELEKEINLLKLTIVNLQLFK